jgi:hypothetical protein
MSGLFIFIATYRLKQARPPAGRCYPSAGLIGQWRCLKRANTLQM